jgi:hypothetical protein
VDAPDPNREEWTMTTYSDWRELAIREADGLIVALLWSDEAQRVDVVVTDTWLHRQIVFTVARDQALDAFRHPFLYAGPHLPPPLPVSERRVAA